MEFYNSFLCFDHLVGRVVILVMMEFYNSHGRALLR